MGAVVASGSLPASDSSWPSDDLKTASQNVGLTAEQADVMGKRVQLWRVGYRPIEVYGPLAKVNSPGKQPVGDGWQNRARLDPPEAATAAPRLDALNTGILCDGLRAIDIDVDDLSRADQLEKLAMEMLGPAPVRGRADSARRLLLYRAAEGEPHKRDIKGSLGKVEVLGRGQQFVAYGTHQGGEAYQWRVADPALYHRDTLNAVTEAQIGAFLPAVAPRIDASAPKPAKVISTAPIALIHGDEKGYRTPSEREHAYAVKALADETAKLAAVLPGGGRNQALNDAALRMGVMIGAGWIELRTVEDALGKASWANGYRSKDGDKAAWATMQSGLTAGMKNPRPPLPNSEILDCVRDVVAQGNLGSKRLPQANHAGLPGGAPSINATAFRWVEPTTIPRREWLYGHHYIRRFVSITVAPGGVGKSSLAIAEALAMVTGRNLIGHLPLFAARVWLWNGEDPLDELRRRITAAMLHHGIEPSEVEGRLFVDSGRTTDIVIAETTRDGTRILTPIVAAVERTINENMIDVMIIDPFVASHLVTENDNNAINAVARTYAAIAERTNCSIELVHHSRKTNNNETTVEDARGASALSSAARSVRTLNRMTKDEAKKSSVDNNRAYFRIDIGKSNLAPAPDNAWWCRIESVPLGNGLLQTLGDLVGVVTPWRWPNHFADVSNSQLSDVKKAIDEGQWRESIQARDWVGYPIGNALNLDPENIEHKWKLKSLIKTWVKQGALVVVTKPDKQRKPRDFVEVGDWAKTTRSTVKGGAAQSDAEGQSNCATNTLI
jgi:hypothetical protein